MFKNQDFVRVGISRDTAVFAVKAIRKWWYAQGEKTYNPAGEIVITADCSGNEVVEATDLGEGNSGGPKVRNAYRLVETVELISKQLKNHYIKRIQNRKYTLYNAMKA
jgi:hypothetical protein